MHDENEAHCGRGELAISGMTNPSGEETLVLDSWAWRYPIRDEPS
jgi:hypothetical protein